MLPPLLETGLVEGFLSTVVRDFAERGGLFLLAFLSAVPPPPPPPVNRENMLPPPSLFDSGFFSTFVFLISTASGLRGRGGDFFCGAGLFVDGLLPPPVKRDNILPPPPLLLLLLEEALLLLVGGDGRGGAFLTGLVKFFF